MPRCSLRGRSGARRPRQDSSCSGQAEATGLAPGRSGARRPRHARAPRRSVRGCGWLCSSHLLRCAPWLWRCQVGRGKQARRIFLTGLFLLTAASILGSASTNSAPLLAARALQGVASAMTAPAALSLLITTFADERQRARVLGLNGSLLSGGFTVGALVGGMLVGVLRSALNTLGPGRILSISAGRILLACRPTVSQPSRKIPEQRPRAGRRKSWRR